MLFQINSYEEGMEKWPRVKQKATLQQFATCDA